MVLLFVARAFENTAQRSQGWKRCCCQEVSGSSAGRVGQPGNHVAIGRGTSKGEREQRREGRRQTRQQEKTEEAEKLKREVLRLISLSEVGKAVSLMNSFGVAPISDPEVRRQLAAKYPEREHDLPARVRKGEAVTSMRGLREGLKSLRRRRSPVFHHQHAEIVWGRGLARARWTYGATQSSARHCQGGAGPSDTTGRRQRS